jgi:hypothetical protein
LEAGIKTTVINRTYAKLFQQGALPQAVRLYGKAAQRRWDGFA